MYSLRKPTVIAVALGLAIVLTMGMLTIFKANAVTPVLQAGVPSEDGIQPEVINGDNPECSDLGDYPGEYLPASKDHSLKFDPPQAGTKTSTDGYLTVTVDRVYKRYLQRLHWPVLRLVFEPRCRPGYRQGRKRGGLLRLRPYDGSGAEQGRRPPARSDQRQRILRRPEPHGLLL